MAAVPSVLPPPAEAEVVEIVSGLKWLPTTLGTLQTSMGTLENSIGSLGTRFAATCGTVGAITDGRINIRRGR